MNEQGRRRIQQALAEIDSEQRANEQSRFSQEDSATSNSNKARIKQALTEIETERQDDGYSAIKTTYGITVNNSVTNVPKKAEAEQRRSIVSSEARRRYNAAQKVSSRERMEWQKEVREHGDGTPAPAKKNSNGNSDSIHGIKVSSSGASNNDNIQGVKITKNEAEEEKKRRRQSVKAIKQEEAEIRSIGRLIENENKYYEMSPDALKQLDYIAGGEEVKEQQMWSNLVAALTNQNGGANAVHLSSAQINAQTARDTLKQKYGMSDDEIEAMSLIHKRMKSAEAEERNAKSARQFADEHGKVASAVSVPASVLGGPLGVIGMADSYLDAQKAKALGMGDIGLDNNNKYNSFRNYSGNIRDEVKQNNNWMVGDFDAFDFIYDTGMSGADSLLSGTLGGWASAIALGAGAATDAATDLTDRGVSSDKAIAGAVAAGTFETLFEKVSLGNLKTFKETSARTAREAAKDIAKTTFVNASEEFNTEVANIVYDYVANGNLSNVEIMMRELTANGMSEEDAKKEVFKRLGLQAVEAGAGGALMGAAFGAGGTAYSQARMANETRYVGRAIKDSGNAKSTIAEGKAAPSDSAAYKAAVKAEERAAKHGGKFGDYAVGKSALENADVYMQAAAQIDGRFKDAENIDGLKELYAAARKNAQSKRDLRALDKDFLSVKDQLDTRETAKQMKAAADDYAQKRLDERTKVEMTNPEIEIKGEKKTVDKIEKVNRDTGEITVKTTSGESVSLSDANVTDKRAAKLYDAAKEYSTDEARLFVNNYADDVDVKSYKQAFEWFRNMGRAGADVEQARKLDNVWGNFFTPEAQEQIVRAGAVNREFHQGVTDLSLVDKNGNYQFKAEKKVLDGICKAFNTEIIIVDSYTNSKGEAANGLYMRDKNRIVIARNADGNLLLRTAGHELYHHVENYASDQAQQLSDYVVSALKEKGVDVDKALERYGKSYAQDKRVSELVGDSMFDVFMDEKFIRKFTNKYNSLAGKIISRLGEIVSNMRNTLKVLASNGKHEEISALSGDVEKLGKIREMLIEGAQKAGENFEARQQAENKKTAEAAENSEEYSIKYTQNIEYTKQIDSIVENKLKRHDALCLGKLSVDSRSGIDSTNYFVMNQSDYRKSTRRKKEGSSISAHEVPTKVMRQLPSLISDAVMFIQRGGNGVTVITNKPALDEKGKPTFYVAGIDKDGNMDGETVNIVKSVYPLADLVNKLTRAAENGTLIATDKSKANNMMSKVGIQYSEGTRIISLAKDSIAQSNSNVNNNFSLKDSVEEKGELIAVHNLSEEKLLKSLSLGGLPMPSIAVLKAKEGHSQYGDISLIFDKSTIDPQATSANKVYSGDAWTPTYPFIEYKPNEKVVDHIRDKYYELYHKYGDKSARPLYGYANEAERKLQNSGGEAGLMEELADDKQMMELFLLDTTGKEFKPIYTEKKTEISKEQQAEYDRIIEALGAETVNEIIPTAGESPMLHRKEYFAKHKEALESLFPHDTKSFDMLFKVRKAATYLKEGPVKTTEELDVNATEKAREKAVDKSAYNSWLQNLFGGIEEKKGIRNNKDSIDRMGNRRSFEALHWEENLENVVQAMKEETQKGGVSLFSGIGIWGVSTKEYGSIGEIKADSGRLVKMSDEENARIKQGFGERLQNIAQAIADPRMENQFIAIDNAYENIVDAVRSCESKDEMLAYFKEYAPKATAETVDSIVDLVKEISEMPARYFEAKPQRAVGFEEVVRAVVPDNISDELRTALEKAGVAISEYVAGDEQSRLEKLNEDDSVLFSKKDDDPTLSYYGEVIAENRIFRQIYASLGDLYSGVREDIHLDNKDIDRVSRKILKQTSSKYSSTQLSKELNAVYDYMSSAKKTNNFNEDWTLEQFVGIAHRILDQSTSVDSELWEQYADTRDWLRRTPIYISPELKAEIEGTYGDYRSYRNLLFGKTRLTTKNDGAIALDEAWGQLHELAPEYFPTDISDKDMPMQLAAFFDAVKKRSVNPYEQTTVSMDEEAALLGSQLFSEYFNVGTLKSDKDKYRGLVYKNMQGTQELRSELRREFNRKNVKNREDYRREYANRVAEFREAKERSERRRVMMNDIERTYKYLNRRIVNESDSAHVPEELKPLVNAYLKMLPASRQQEFNRESLFEFMHEYSKFIGESAYTVNEELVSQLEEFGRRNVSGEGANARYRDLSDIDLEIAKNIGEQVQHLVKKGNQVFADNIKATISTIAHSEHTKLDALEDSPFNELPENHSKIDSAKMSKDEYKHGLMMPQYLFESISGQNGAFAQLYKNLRSGENIQASIVAEAREKEREIKQRNHYDERWSKKTVSFESLRGKVTMTIEQAMSLYATMKRNQGKDHIFNGGFYLVQKEKVEHPGKKLKKSKVEKSLVLLDRETGFDTISRLLTDDQRNYVDDMVTYITNDIGARRNEVSLKLYGIKRYLEKYYYPIVVDKNFIDTQIGQSKVVQTIKNQSSSKRTAKHASNPVIISGFTDTVNHHIYDSSLYCAYVLPLADIKRVYNYREKTVNELNGTGMVPGSEWSIKNDLMKKKGKNAVEQIEKFLTAVDSGQRSNDLLPISARMMSRAKKAAVMGNLSVVVQQPTAVFRAMLYIEPKYFATVASKADIAEMKKWNGCALIKEIGYFDVNMGRNAIDYINEYSADKRIKAERNIKEKVEIAAEKAMPKVDQVTGWAAGKADEITWGAIWNACKKQTAAQSKGLSGDELNARAAELFQDVIGKTQVYDSVFTKCDYLRRKEGFTMMAMQFMSEPVTTLNMMYEAVTNAKKSEDAKKKCGRAFACYVTSLVVNSAVKSVVYAIRDDDDDKSFWEKYLGNAVSGVITDGFGILPYIKDVISIVHGYDVSRLDMAAFSSLVDATKTVLNEDRSMPDKILKVLKAVGQFTGVPAYNIGRDFRALLDTCDKIKKCLTGEIEKQPTTATGIKEAIKGELRKEDSVYQQLYEANVNGDFAHYQKIYGNLRRKDKDTSTINSSVRQVIKKEYLDGKIDRTTALERLKDWPGKNDKPDANSKRVADWDEEKEEKEEADSKTIS
jgi:hypothetical protein|uniref:Nuclease n=1 Tax=Podoviridae sp. ctKS020 TaxID=2826552 RepID=A0A8S5QTV2_9CAUD|nr:MAG TPA: nuclease [Podoviridae sp. ctKS020]